MDAVYAPLLLSFSSDLRNTTLSAIDASLALSYSMIIYVNMSVHTHQIKYKLKFFNSNFEETILYPNHIWPP